jgi:hypothetical protein
METLSKQDLEIFRMRMISDIERLLETTNNHTTEEFDWLRRKAVRKMMDISPATLQNLRITGKIRHKNVLGSYYYNKNGFTKII